MKKIWRNIFNHAHELGAIYYLYSLVVSVMMGAYGLYKKLAEPTIVNSSAIYFYVFVVAASVVVIVIPLLIANLLKKNPFDQHPISNPQLRMISRKSTYKIRRDGLIKTQRIKLQAVEPVNLYEFSTMLTGNGSVRVKLTAPTANVAHLIGPNPRRSSSIYQVVFADPISQDHTVEIELETTVNDPQQTMRAYVADSFIECKQHGAYEASHEFNPMPKEVRREVFSSLTNTPIQPLEIVMLHGNTATLKVDKVIDGAAYSVSWIW
ncbi:MAG: hypothetical protein QM533_01200 [Cytophagales bacterium]|nr:hypothetical protein [Cytophagales bacterium]